MDHVSGRSALQGSSFGAGTVSTRRWTCAMAGPTCATRRDYLPSVQLHAPEEAYGSWHPCEGRAYQRLASVGRRCSGLTEHRSSPHCGQLAVPKPVERAASRDRSDSNPRLASGDVSTDALARPKAGWVRPVGEWLCALPSFLVALSSIFGGWKPLRSAGLACEPIDSSHRARNLGLAVTVAKQALARVSSRHRLAHRVSLRSHPRGRTRGGRSSGRRTAEDRRMPVAVRGW